MTTTNIILILAMLLTATALLWLGAYEVGFAAALKRERALADRRVQGVLDELRRKQLLAPNLGASWPPQGDQAPREEEGRLMHQFTALHRDYLGTSPCIEPVALAALLDKLGALPRGYGNAKN